MALHELESRKLSKGEITLRDKKEFGRSFARKSARQLLGSSNFTGPRWMHILSGHLSYQVEHHVFPDIPAHRYPEIGRKLEKICARHGIACNTGSLPNNFTLGRPSPA